MPALRRFDIDELLTRPGTYFNPDTEIVLVVDEVQDLTNAELTLALRLLEKPGQFVLCGDANQIVVDMAREVLPIVRHTPVLAGVCGTDVSQYKLPLRGAPLIMGHENVGTLTKVGSQFAKHKGFSEGDRVFLRSTMTGTHEGDLFGIPPTRREVKVMQIQIERIRDGRIVEHWRVTDELSLMRPLGGGP